jgi:hypothetical protein
MESFASVFFTQHFAVTTVHSHCITAGPCVNISIIVYFHWNADGHLGCFQNILVHFYWWTYMCISFGIYLGVELLCHRLCKWHWNHCIKYANLYCNPRIIVLAALLWHVVLAVFLICRIPLILWIKILFWFFKYSSPCCYCLFIPFIVSFHYY